MEINKHAVSELLVALLRDVRRIGNSNTHVSTLCHHLEGCLEMAAKRVGTRGEYEYPFVYMPSVGKLVDKGLSSRTFDWKGFYSLNGKPDKALHAAICELFHKESEHGEYLGTNQDGGMQMLPRKHPVKVEGGLRDEVTAEHVFLLRQTLYVLKNVDVPCPEQKVKDAVHEFISIDQGLRRPSGSWNSDHWYAGANGFCGDPDLSGSHPRARKLWQTVDDVFASIVPMHEVDRLRIRPKHGPGAVADLKSGKDKYSFPHWPTKLEGQFSEVMFAHHSEELHFSEEVTIKPSRREPPARLIAVPKTFKGPRLIASEPIAHQFLQQGLMDWIRQHMNPILSNSINFLSQEDSRSAALLASRRGDLATVDLSSASDRLSCWTVERAFYKRQSLLRCLHAVRTRIIVDGTGTDEDLSLLMRKFAAQGSAVTFPVQTIIYAGLAIAASLFDEGLPATRKNIKRVARKVRVFGDDIVCPRGCVPILTLMLDSLQLKVNASKTHISGGFRESCGMDAYLGVDVTPAYHSLLEWDKSPEKASSWVEVSNNFHMKGLWETASWMMEQVPHKMRRKFLITDRPGDGYRFFTFCRGYSTQAQVRYSHHLHRTEALVFAERTRVDKKKRESWHDFYQWLVETPDPQSKWTAGYVTKKTSRIREVWAPVD